MLTATVGLLGLHACTLLHNRPDKASAMLSAAGAGWVVGRCVDPTKVVKDALKLDKGKDAMTTAAMTLALCDEEKQATPMIDVIEKRYPQDTADWKDADADLPVLAEAKKEHAQL